MKHFYKKLKNEVTTLHYPDKTQIISSTKFVVLSSIILAAIISLVTTGTSELCSLIINQF